MTIELSGEVIEKIEERLRECWKDPRLFRYWAEYSVALQVKTRNPSWKIVVSPNQSADIACYADNDKKNRIIIEVKTGLIKKDSWKELFLTSANAIFSSNQSKNANSFQFAVFLVHENYEKIIKTFVFSKKELKELEVLAKNKSSKYLISYVESLEELTKWREREHKIIFELEKFLVKKPEMFQERWDKIKFE